MGLAATGAEAIGAGIRRLFPQPLSNTMDHPIQRGGNGLFEVRLDGFGDRLERERSNVSHEAQTLAEAELTPEERKQQTELDRMIRTPSDKVTLTALTDQAFRSEAAARAATVAASRTSSASDARSTSLV